MLQLGSAALLFWESIAKDYDLELIDNEMRLQDGKSFPLSLPERILNHISLLFSYAMFFGAILLVAWLVFLLAKPDDTKALVKSEIVVFASGALLFAITQLAGRVIQNSINRYISNSKNAQFILERRELTSSLSE